MSLGAAPPFLPVCGVSTAGGSARHGPAQPSLTLWLVVSKKTQTEIPFLLYVDGLLT